MVSFLQKCFFFVVTVLGCASKGVLTLKIFLDVPDKVAPGQNARLTCDYDLEGEDLYSLEWYKDIGPYDQILFQYEYNKDGSQIFPLQGVNVDPDRTSMGTLYITNITSAAEGVYGCEVITHGGPIKRRDTKEKFMHVEDDKETSGGMNIGDAFKQSFESNNGKPAEINSLYKKDLLTLLTAQQLKILMLEEETCTFFASFGEYLSDMTEREKLKLHMAILQKISDIKSKRKQTV